MRSEILYALHVSMAIIAGVSATIQSAAVAKLQAKGGKSFSALVATLIGAFCNYIDIFSHRFKITVPELQRNEPIYPWLSGLPIAIIILTLIFTVPNLGVAVVLSVMVSSQLIFACIIDHFGLLGVTARDFTWQRGIGCISMVVGVVLISFY
ncbi:hypothetical protein RhiirA4_454438 [Rhizophagus irregularis]|uniref:DUF606-domain-containing protein n=1 Tax=Rhizophagus irregularis TaxID=588596 RepID=A0A2I1G2U2_9GLOM|nr:hypothetical protein RhiirA4_454438 [Rhizophagus irregularis]